MDILKNNNYNKFETILLCIGMTIVAGFLINIGGLLVLFLPIQNLGVWQLVIPAIFMFIGFIVIPTLIISRLIGFKIQVYKKINFIRFIIYIILIFSITLILNLNIENNLQSLIVATCEEYLFRGILFGLLLSKFGKIKTFIIGSLIFSLLLHLNGNFVENLIIKFPSGILLYLIADKLGLENSILFHWLHNFVVSEFID